MWSQCCSVVAGLEGSTRRSPTSISACTTAPPLDIDSLQVLAREVASPEASVTRPGEWGPWVDGGGWLHIGGTAVDWIYRDLDRVHKSWVDAQAGRCDFHFQIGHPFGVADFVYAGEVALGVVLADPSGEVTALQLAARRYPPLLRDALVAGLWEASFSIEIARKAVTRGIRHTSRGASSGWLRCALLRCTGTPHTGSSTRKVPLPRLADCRRHPPASPSGPRALWPISVPPLTS